jgi:cytoskeletal protein CcmA (bactofilin family)
MKKLWIFGLLLGLVAFATPALAADFRAPVSDSGNITVGEEEQVGNLYLAGTNVTSNPIVTGDLITAGSNVTINGTVQQSILAAGGTLTINANVGQSARVAGGTVTFNGQVTEDLAIGGGTIDLTKNSLVTGDLLIAGGAIKIDGTIGGKVYGSGGDVIISGHVKGDVKLTDINSLELTSGAIIDGMLTYSSISEAKINSNAQVLGGTNYDKTAVRNNNYKSDYSFSIWMALASLMLGLFIVYGFKRTTLKIVEENKKKFWAALGIGVVVAIIAPIIGFVLMVTVIGVKISMLLGIFFWMFVLLGGVFNSIFLGSEIYHLAKKEEPIRLDWLTVLIGVVVNSLLFAIPVFGWIVWAGIFMSSFGTLIKHIFADFPQKA